MTVWFRAYFADDDVWLYFEADDDGWAVRQAELRGADSRAVAAASMAEVLRLRDHAGPEAVGRYERRYGSPASVPLDGWREWPGAAEVSAAEFERVWTAARRSLGAAAEAVAPPYGPGRAGGAGGADERAGGA